MKIIEQLKLQLSFIADDGQPSGGSESDVKKDQTTVKPQSSKDGPDRRERRPNNKDKGKSGAPWKNDWRWYAITEQIAKDVANIPFNVIPGVGFDPKYSTNSSAGLVIGSKQYTQHCTTIHYCPSVGRAQESGDGVNIAARQLYAFVRHANSGARNYEAPDIMMYVLALSDIYSSYAFIKKALGLARLYVYENRYLPDLLLNSMGVDPDDLRSRIAQYRGRLNILCAKINSLAVPKYFKIFDRGVYINSKVFTDSDSIRGQMYQFVKDYAYKWSGKTSETGTELLNIIFADDIYNLEYYLDILDGQIEALLSDEDAAIISGDILKAFGDANLYSLVETPDEYVVMPVFDEDVLAQIENAKFVERVGTFMVADGAANVTQEDQLIKFTPRVNYITAMSQPTVTRAYELFNSHKNNVEYTDILEWSRLMSVVTGEMVGPSYLIEAGSEICLYAIMSAKTISPAGVVSIDNVKFVGEILVVDKIDSSGNHTITYPLDSLSVIPRIMQYDWHPEVLYVYASSNNGQPFNCTIGGSGMDIKKYTYIALESLAAMHDAATTAVVWNTELYKRAK